MAAIECDRLVKCCKETVVVDEVTFRVEFGRVTGFLGLKGAGRATCLRMITGLVAPTSGTKCGDVGVDGSGPTHLSG
ncbi:hypothetical protein DMH15_02860 [Streptomyces sp. WAC 06725]|uniref:ATP-binding cassette domain-containing protein n=1 Tax=Streptomyces sp. WAC 06725 TaxID=2203209 RepID=UPI000F748132|nr:ATP-binding cassette domain-containing protein [Streptomyces sp. WAC 06725]RSO49628.1 hypothetical protein DMH15_02860 [Streptomyces sp. WAC 06725]